MKIHFCRSEGFVSWIIRTFTMSRWNHVAIEINGVIFHATGKGGVHVTTPHNLDRNYPISETVPVEAPDKEAAQAFLVKQLGKKYDWGAVVGMFFRAGWESNRRWFCSELIASALQAGGKSMRLSHHRVTPRDLWAAL